MPLTGNCDYCGQRGDYFTELDPLPDAGWVCKDLKACLARELKAKEADGRYVRADQSPDPDDGK